MSNHEEFMQQEDFAEETFDAADIEQEVAVDQTEISVEEVDSLQQSEEAESESEKPKEDWKKSLFKDVKDILVILASFMLVYVLFFRVVVVVGDSMFDTLVDGDRLLLISGILYNDPKQGDIVVAATDNFKDGEPIVKRIIATEGQVVDIDFTTGTVYVDGVALVEDYIFTLTLNNEGVKFPVTVPEGCIFVMGDNRKESLDSRSPQIGFIDEREILGKAIFLVWPGNGSDKHPVSFDFGRIGVVE